MSRFRDQRRSGLEMPQHQQARAVLRVVGPVVMAAGLILVLIGFGSFFKTFSDFGSGDMGPPRYFWCAFLGMPMMFVGIILSAAGYGAVVQRYMSTEMAPVARDTFNELAHGTTPGVRAMAGALSEGLAGGHACPSCRATVPSDADYCPGCGAPQSAATCPGCGEPTVVGAKFCHRCGAAVREPEIA